MVSIAREILLHDKLRFAITVVSLGFAIVMIVYDTAMFFGVTGDSVSLIDRSQAQLWVFKKGNDHLSALSLVPHSLLGKARKMAGVGEACALDYRMGNLQVARNHQVAMVGIDPACPLLLPWNVVQGDLESLARKDTVIVDDLALRSDPAAVGDVVKINDQKLHVVGVTHGNKSFSYPFVYVNLKTFETIGGSPDDYSFVMVQVTPGADQNQVIRQLTGVNDMDAHTAQEFSAATITALIEQGVGMIFVVVAVGVFVGMLIVTLTMYTATMEHLRDFAILKAIGATRRKVLGIVLEQAITETTVGFGIGLAASFGADRLVEALSGISTRFPVPMVAGTFVAMTVLAILGSLISVRRAVTVDPMIVFRA